MRILRVAAMTAALSMAAAQAAHAEVLIRVDLNAQRMTVEVDGQRRHIWPVSTAAAEYVTPTGTYKPERLHEMWYSKQYDDAPMPHSIFYSGGYAIHGTQSVRRLGQPASHGCVRLAPKNAETLYKLVEDTGKKKTRIVIYGQPPAPVVASRRATPRLVYTYRAPQGLFDGLFSDTQPRRIYRTPDTRRYNVNASGVRSHQVPTYRYR